MLADDVVVADAPAPVTTRRLDIQGLRGVAVGLVVAFHAGLPVSGGYAGVDMFFVISGFVITRLLLGELEHEDGIGFVSFYSRRARRLLPAMGVLIVFVALASVLLLGPMNTQQQTAMVGIATSVFAANLGLFLLPNGYFNAPAASVPLLHMWSLAVEEQFYLFFPAFLLLSWRLGQRFAARRSVRRTCLELLFAGALLSFGLELWLTYVSNTTRLPFYLAPARAWEFAAGGLVALAEPAIRRIRPTVAIGLGVVGAVLVVVMSQTLSATTIFPGVAALIPVGATVLLIVGGTVSLRGVPQLLQLRPIVWLGDVSYGWYLWHWPFIVFAEVLWPDSPGWVLPAAALLSLLPTWGSYVWIERPIRSNTGLTGRRVLPLAFGCIAVPLVLYLLVLGLNVEAPRHSKPLANLQAASRLHTDSTRDCDSGLPVGSTHPWCTWFTPHSHGDVVLIGDSNAGQFTEGAVAAARYRGFNLTVAADSGCPFADLLVTDSTQRFDSAGCRRFYTRSMAAMARARPALVIVASSSLEYLHDGNGVTFRDPTTGEVAHSSTAKARLWTRGLASMLQDFNRAGVPVLLVHNVPNFKDFSTLTCPGYKVYRQVSRCNEVRSRAAIAATQRLSRQAEDAALDQTSGAVGVDFTPDICTPTRCETLRGGVWLYRDGSHLSIAGAETLTFHLSDLIAANARGAARATG